MTRPADDGVPAAEHDPLATPHEVSALDDALDFDLDAMLLDASPVEAAPQLDAVAEAEAPVLQPADLSAVTALDDSEAEALAALRDPAVRQIVPELGKYKNATSAKAQRLLGWSPRSSEDALAATAESLLRLGLVKP